MSFVIPFFISHQGCPHQCLFCNQHSITGTSFDRSKLRQSVDDCIEEWLGYRRDDSSVQFAFYGGSFTCLPDELQAEMLAAVRAWIDRGVIDSIRLSTRPDCIDENRCEILKDAGVRIVELGVQSFDDAVLNASKRGHSREDILTAYKHLASAGLQTGIQLMPGLPGETRKSFLAGVQETIRLRPAMVRLYPTLVISGSPLAEEYEKGNYRPLSLGMATVLVAKALNLLNQADIPVIRMGLQPSPSLEENLVAGPYHPSFGELVLARRWLQRVRQVLARHPGKRLRLTISKRDLSAFNGIHGANRKRMQRLGLDQHFELEFDDNMERGTLNYAVC